MNEKEFAQQLEDLEKAKVTCLEQLQQIEELEKLVVQKRNTSSRNIFYREPDSFHCDEDGTNHTFWFQNNRGASVSRNKFTYGNRDGGGLFELAVLDSNNELDYTTEITSDVIGWLEVSEVNELLKRIEELEEA